MTKNETIKATLKATKAKRKTQTCIVYKVKIDKSHLNHVTKVHLNRLFLEAKWLYNHILSQDNIFEMDYKFSDVPVKVKNIFEMRDLRYLSAQMKQSILSRAQDNIRGLSELKTNGHKIGKLNYKSEVQSIPLKQYGGTYDILDTKHVRIEKIKQKLKVIGLKQLPEGVDIANGNLVHKNGDYYLSITTYQEKKKQVPTVKSVGIDLGLSRQLVLSNSVAIQYVIPVSPKLRKLARKLSKQELHSKNWNKTRIKLDKEYEKANNIKKDIKNKVVSHLKDNYGTVCFQDENVKAWQRIWGRKILYTSIGGIISTLKQKVHTPVEVNRMYPSTKTCSKCGNIQEIALDERVYVCRKCGNILDRDHNSSINIENEGLRKIGTVRTELTPVEIEANTLISLRYLNSIPYVKASSVYESGSLTALA